ncbi:MAG: NAD-dependent epimerase/dehydratase family protein [Myxococcales bacterium]|nr:NAD-dependent epimerase/dehydratase family protein [Myxococcales bacterium]
MRKPVVMITGANGEIGQRLIERLSDEGTSDVVALDLHPLPPALASRCLASIAGDILDEDMMQRVISEYAVHAIFHLAALLSTRAEYTPFAAHRVNVGGTLKLLDMAADQARRDGHPVKFIFPSSIAVYGLPDLATKHAAGRVVEGDFNAPTTMYGCNKLYCEQLGRYYMKHFGQLNTNFQPSGVDFRSLRFPGLISAQTVPSGGTSDFGPEMVHFAAKGQPYACFVPEQAQIPFMAMPDGVEALLALARAPREKLSQHVYNIGAFSLSAGDFRDRVQTAFPGARVSFSVDRARSGIINTWPLDVNDSPARNDWGWNPKFGASEMFDDYLLPALDHRAS